jgi:hypothetical protein
MSRTAICLVLGVCALAACSRQRTSSHLDLDARVYWVRGVSDDAFVRLCEETRWPCGEEVYQTDIFNLQLASDTVHTVRGVLDVIVQHNPHYIWSVRNGVLLLRPKSPAWQSETLGSMIRDFSIVDLDLNSAVAKVAEKLDLQMMPATIWDAMPTGLARNMLADSNVRLTVRTHGKTAEELLNLLVVKHGHAMWRLIHSSARQRPGKSESVDGQVLDTIVY